MSKLDMLTPDNSAIALIDYQPAMYQGVQSHDRLVVFNNVQILAKAAKLFKIPTVLSTVAKDSFSGPFMPEVADLFPNHDIIDRTSMNSWLNANFRKAVAATGRKKFVIGGLWTEACVMFPALDMLKGSSLNFVGNVEGHDLFTGKVDVVVMDGFTGNVVLKASETAIELVFDLIRAGMPRGLRGALQSLLMRKAFEAELESEALRRMADRLREGTRVLSVPGPTGGARALAVAASVVAERRPAIVLCAGDAEARDLSQEIRFFLMYSHYRKRLNYSDKAMKAAAERLRDFRNRVKMIGKKVGSAKPEESLLSHTLKTAFVANMDNDMSVKSAFDAMQNVLKKIDLSSLSLSQAAGIIRTLRKVDEVCR